VSNYPLQKRSQQEIKQLNRVIQLRKIEMAEAKVMVFFINSQAYNVCFNRPEQLMFQKYRPQHSIQKLMMNMSMMTWVLTQWIWVNRKKKEIRTQRLLLAAEEANMAETVIYCMINFYFTQVKEKNTN